MSRHNALRGPSAVALSLVLLSISAHAQQSLPTIDVGRARPKPARVGAVPPTSSQTQGGDSAAQNPASAPVSFAEPKTPAEGYVVRDATTALKTDLPLRETPASVVVVPRQVVRDQAVTRLQETLENVSSVRSNSNNRGGYVYKIRGFTSFDVYRNSLALPGDSFAGMTDMANIERVEVLKGPASVLYGRAEPGGVINLVTKQPTFKERYVVDQQIGSFNHYRTQWDFTAPVKAVDGLAWRFSGAYQDSDSFLPYANGNRILFAPVVTYQPSAWTEFTADLQYLGNTVHEFSGIPVIGAAPAPIPIRRTFNELNDPRDRTAQFIGSYYFRQNLNEDWKIVNRFHYGSTWFNARQIVPISFDPDLATLNRSTTSQNLQGDTYATNINLEGKFTTFGAKHNFLFGLDYLHRYYDYYYSIGAGNYPINIYSPVYGTVSPWGFQEGFLGAGFNGHSSFLARQKGMYVQDQINFFDDRAHLLLGARYDVADVTNGDSFGNYDANGFPLFDSTKAAAIAARLRAPTNMDKGWSPRAGIAFDILPELTIHGSYSRSFGANNGRNTTGEIFPAQRGTQWEVGLKAQVLQDLNVALAFYQITKSNVTTLDFSTPDPADRRTAGIQRSRGVELDILGRVTDRLSVISNYAYTDAKVIADNLRDPLDPFGSGLLGNHLDNVPRHSGKLFATYDFGDNGLGLRVGGGPVGATHAWGDIQNTFLLPSWVRLDAFASYTTLFEGRKLTAQLNLDNLTNTKYYTGNDIFFNNWAPRMGVLPAPPFQAIGTLRVEF